MFREPVRAFHLKPESASIDLASVVSLYKEVLSIIVRDRFDRESGLRDDSLDGEGRLITSNVFGVSFRHHLARGVGSTMDAALGKAQRYCPIRTALSAGAAAHRVARPTVIITGPVNGLAHGDSLLISMPRGRFESLLR